MLSLGSAPDLLRLLAVPVFGWAAWRDIRTRRVPNRTWLPLVGLGVLALAVEGWLVLTGQLPVFRRGYVFRVVFSVGLLVPLSYGFWLMGGFGGADAKALITLAVLFPTFPTYFVGDAALPLVVTTLGVFSLTVLSNTVVAGVFYPIVLFGRNAVAGRVSPAMFIGRPVPWRDATAEYGRLLQTPDGFTRNGLDLDALRMYLRWRDTTLAAVREDPAHYRDPATIPAEPNDPGDGSIPVDRAEETATDGGGSVTEPADAAAAVADPWGAERFLDDIEGSAYGTSPEQLRAGLETLTTAEEVWITPGVPFLVPMFVGLVVGLVYGDVLFAALRALGVA